MKTIDTLVKDVEHVIDTGEGWTKEIQEWFEESVGNVITRQLTSKRSGPSRLRMSNMGQPCERKLYYDTRPDATQEVFDSSTRLKFMFGDVTESLLLALTMASGHRLEGMQDTMTINGVNGSRDCIIDGMLVDAKSASSMAFKKFKEGSLRENDPFGYISQLSSYLYAGQDDPLITNKTHAAFFVVDKQFGHICLDIHDLSEDMKNKEAEVERKKKIVSGNTLPPRAFDPIPDGKSGNMKLGTNCSYCNNKNRCWENLQTYIYSTGPRFFTKVVREPKVFKLED